MARTGSLALLAPGIALKEPHTLSKVVCAKKPPKAFQELSSSCAGLPATQLKSVPISIVFLRSNTFSTKPGSTGILKDFFFFFFSERGKKNPTTETEFPTVWSQSLFPCFPILRRAHFFNITTSWQIAQEMFRLEICVLFVQTEFFCICHQTGRFVCLAWGKW